MSEGRSRRPVFCLHPKNVDPPSPLANLQTIRAEQSDIEKWIRNDLWRLLKLRRIQTEDKIKAAAKNIEKLVNATGPVNEHTLKPLHLDSGVRHG